MIRFWEIACKKVCKKKKKVKKGTDWKQEGFPLETEYLKYEVFNNYKTTATTIKQMKSRKKVTGFLLWFDQTNYLSYLFKHHELIDRILNDLKRQIISCVFEDHFDHRSYLEIRLAHQFVFLFNLLTLSVSSCTQFFGCLKEHNLN